MIPNITNATTPYCFLLSFSFKNILDNIIDTILYAEIIGAAIMLAPLIA